MVVPKENIWGNSARGWRVALTVLDFGRTTFGASCTGAAKFCVAKAVSHANSRRQFGETLGSFELVKDKLAYMSAGTFCHGILHVSDRRFDRLRRGRLHARGRRCSRCSRPIRCGESWNDTFQIYGGKAYFTDEPFERMLRDARINMIGEGANDVLRNFIALVGMRGRGPRSAGSAAGAQESVRGWVEADCSGSSVARSRRCSRRRP